MRAHRQRLRDVAEREHAAGRVAVGEHRRERRERAPPGRAARPRRARPSSRRPLVGVDEHRDPDAPLGRVEAGERELDPPQLRVAEDAADDRANPAELLTRAAAAARRPPPGSPLRRAGSDSTSSPQAALREDEQPQRRGRPHRGEPRIRVAAAPLERAQLAEEVSRPELARVLPVDRDRRRALEDHEELAAEAPLLDDRLPESPRGAIADESRLAGWRSANNGSARSEGRSASAAGQLLTIVGWRS